MNQAPPSTNKPKTKSISKGWNRSLKTWLALEKARGGNAAAVFRDELRRKKVGCFPEHLGLAQLDKKLRGAKEWWAGRGR